MQSQHTGRQGKVWGSTTRVHYSSSTIVEHVSAVAGWRCSKHKHPDRYNQFYVVKGLLRVVCWKDDLQDSTLLGPGCSTVIAPGVFHYFEAIEPTEMIEVYWMEFSHPGIERVDHGQQTIPTLTRVG